MNAEPKKQNAIVIGRVSSTKQGLLGDSLEDQEKQTARSIERIENLHHCTIVVKNYFEFTESASGALDFQPLLKAVDYCKDPNNQIKFAFIKSIDRVTRAGSGVYGMLKQMFTNEGVVLVDTYGIISAETVNTLDHLGVKYKWSEYSPSWTTELLESERAKSEVRDILTRMIGASIRYIRMGYRVRPAPMGYTNQKIETPHGLRVILVPNAVESKWFIKMYTLRIQGNLGDQEIVDEINALGFRTRRLKIRDKQNRERVIGYKGGRQLTVKDLQRYIQNPIYAGVSAEKWVDGQPIKTRFPGLVSIETFNQANKGKMTIVEEEDKVIIYKGVPPSWLLKKNMDNPLYPYKKYILCPECRKPFLGSAPRGRFPTYHCGAIRRGHKYLGIPVKMLHDAVEVFVKHVEFSDDYFLQFRKIVLEEWEKREKMVTDDTIIYNQRVAQIGEEVQLLKEKIKVLTSVTAIQLMEEDIDKLQQEKLDVMEKRNKKEKEEFDIYVVMGQIKYYMENFEDLLLGGSDPLRNAALFGLIFDETPTYQELIDGTVRLSPLFKLNEEYKHTKSIAVGPDGVEPSTCRLRRPF